MSDYESLSELMLIRKSRRGDVKAFSELYARIHKDLYKFALYTLKHPQDAEDAVSEAVISAYENLGMLRKERSFRFWIFRILSNQCKKRFRGREQIEVLEPEMAAPEKDYAELHDVREAFGILNVEERMIVAFSVFGGYQSGEIGSMMQQNPATIRSKKSRALGKMRSVLE
ncbi:RNA polymerase sigma factor [Clostridium sp. C105KSO13]|uniref:RNA polymerase sigma factor n=1 Tax=Clostridium sp. C105KSO13 TaxID=1776045 RepID=UPI0007408450|nr:RNA polymerase sigma factor [Clostridium sp. C105KSO13]CUX37328.1 ECF RNA polymerase sigma factor SigM [Clostridium sp. C105KSO13]